MKIPYAYPTLLLCCLLIACTDPQRTASSPSELTITGYDSLLAKQLGADQYGMRPYVMAFLKSGPNRTQDSLAAAELQRAHMDNISRLAEEGTLVFAGPFMDDFDVRGIYIFAVETIEEARTLTATDPAVQAGRLEMELHPFYGSAALMQINEIHEKISKEGI